MASANDATNGPVAAPAGTAVPAAPAAPLPTEKIIAMIVNQVRQKPHLRALLEKKASSAEDLVIKGQKVAPSVLKQAIAILDRDAPAATAATPTRSASTQQTVPAEASARWNPTAAAGVSAKASEECEHAKPFNRSVRVRGGELTLLAKPDVSGNATGESIPEGTCLETIMRVASQHDGRVYLRFKGRDGWASTRSRTSFQKVAVEPTSGDPIEPPEFAKPSDSAALAVLPRVDAAGLPVQQQPAGGAAAQRAPRSFCASCRISILSSPNVVSGVGASHIQAGERFEADGVYFAAGEHRAYLRLTGGRGWVSERLRTHFHRFAASPVDARVAETAESAKRARLDDGGGKTFAAPSLEPSLAAVSPAGAAKTASPPKKSQATPLAVFRSDEDLWPMELRPPKPISSEIRMKMRKCALFFVRRINEAEEDMKEAQVQANTYARSCPAQKELTEFVGSVQKEISDYRAEWVAAVTPMLA